ncbi:MAG: F0F1 ATP synthase subunit A [Endomicrobiales bacterium]|nr:F0F1 ATP synthase subunit A [Endomicrobiales bacterium]
MISLAPEKVIQISGLSVTNTVAATLLTDAVLIAFVWVVYRKVALAPGGVQNAVEIFVEAFHNLTEQVAGSRVKSIFPWFASLFIFIFFSNFLALLPGYGVFGLEEHHKIVPFLRAPSSDLNVTLGLALVSVAASHVLSVKYVGLWGYLKHFFSINPLFLFIGILELVSEGTKLVSLSFRLFGNIFAGDVVLGQVSSYLSFLAPVPFLMLEVVVAVVQALVFAMLTMVFMSVLTEKH